MRENPADVITQRILDRAGSVSERLTKQLKNIKPFATEIIPPSVKIWAADNLGLMDLFDLQKEFGDEALGKIKYDIEKLRMDGRRKQSGQ